MANSSIYAAFERMWQHVVAKIGSKADLIHTHDDYVTNVYADENFALKSEIVNVDLSAYETKTDSQTKFDEAKTYADSAANTVKNDLLNGAGAAYDTLKELGNLIDDNADAIDALNTVAANKADKDHVHELYETKEDAQVKYDTIIDAKADWNQNDETAIDYVKNRTHWVEEATELLFVEQSVDANNLIKRVDLSEELMGCDMQIGQTFIVTVDGVSYRCVSWNFIGEVRIGDSRLQSNVEELDTTHLEDVPFLIDYYVEVDEFTWGATTVYAGIMFSTAGTHTLKIERVLPDQTTYHTLNENFIPDTIARKEYVDENFALKSDIPADVDLSNYETKTDAKTKFDSAKVYTDQMASGKADTVHTHSISDVTTLQNELNEIKAQLSQKSQVQIIKWEDND